MRLAAVAALVASLMIGVAGPAAAAPPVVSTSDQAISEGLPGFIGQVATFADADGTGSFTATIDWGDGSPIDACPGACTITHDGDGTGSVSGSHSYVDGPDDTATVTVTVDDGTESGVGTFTMTVDNVAPTIELSGAVTVDEGSTYTLTLGAVTDPGDDTVAQYIVDWGDGSAAEPFPAAGDVTHVYEDGVTTPTIIVDLMDEDGTHATAGSKIITVDNAAPIVEAGADQTTPAGGTIDLDPATFSDAGVNDTHTALIDWGDGTTPEPGNVDPVLGTVDASHVFGPGGPFTVTVQVTDNDGATGADTFTVTIVNSAPVVTPVGPQSALEGSAFTGQVASFTDPDPGDTHTATIDWGDGSPLATGTVDQTLHTVAGTHTYVEDGLYTVTVTVDDGTGSDSATFDITVGNAAPVVVAGNSVSINEGDSVTLAPATFADTGITDTHTAEVDWGDGTVEPCVGPPQCSITDNGGDGQVDGSHTYTATGVYTVTVTVTDDDGAAGSDAFAVTVANSDFNVEILGGDKSIAEGGIAFLDATFADLDGSGSYTATIDWGDGTVEAGVVTTTGPGTGTVAKSHVYADNCTCTLSLTVDDTTSADQGFDAVTTTVTNVAPTASITGPASGSEGSPLSFNGVRSDPGADSFTYAWTVTKDGAPFSTATTKNLTLTPDDNASYVLSFTVTDDDGGVSNTATKTVTIANVGPSPVIRAGDGGAAPSGGPEGRAVELRVAANDPGDDRVSHVWEARLLGALIDSGTGRRFDFVPPDDGTYFVSVTSTDEDGDGGTASLLYVARNRRPSVDEIRVDATPDPATPVTLRAFYSDPGTADTHRVTIDWGDGTLTSINNAPNPAVASHAFSAAGAYPAEVCITDDNGGTRCADFFFNVGFDVDVGSDFDGDGFEDLAVGIRGEDSRAGAVAVIPGSGGGPTADGDRLWRQGAGGLADTAEAGDEFGKALAHGDFNGDGYSDLAIGAPREDLGGISNSGSVHVLYGSAAGLVSSGSQVWHQDTPGVRGRNEVGDTFGASLVAGDFNGDGFADLGIGVPGEDLAGVSNAGRVALLFGSPQGLTADGDESWDQDAAGIRGRNEAGDRYGTTLASADFDGDGYWDLAVGAPGEAVGGNNNAGAVAIIEGRLLGLTATGDRFWTQNTSGIANSAEKGDKFGAALAAGDVDGDGYPELAVGVPGESLRGAPRAGAVAVLAGSPTGLSTSGDALWHEETPGIRGAAEARDRFGAAVAIGDVDDDGYGDLAVGIPGQDVAGARNAGAVSLILGSGSGLSPSGDQRWHQETAGVKGRARNGDRLGSALTLLTGNRDGDRYLAIGIPNERVSGQTKAGSVLVLKGASRGLKPGGDIVLNQDTPGILNRAEARDRFGGTL